MDTLARIADAVLYEGYILWPYRRDALKNRQRWTFGGIHPQAYSAQRGGDDPSEAHAGCLLETTSATRLDVRLRFLHVVARQAQRDGKPVEEVEVGGERHLSWDEATERELSATALAPSELEPPKRVPISIPGGERREELAEECAVVRSWRALEGLLEIRADRLGPELVRIGVVVRNTTPWDGAGREETLRQTFCSTHIVLQARDGAFVSQTDPPDELRAHADACRNEGTWPVLVGEQGDRSTVLCSPIILPDYPQIAPESPGDLFDAGEIDQMLVLNILSMTEEERREMRDADPRTREILERTEALSEQELMRLHGTIREFGLARRP